jgi:hypothetical protein
MKSNFAKLPDFVGGAIDFGALSATTNLSKMLTESSCSHVEVLKEKIDIESPAKLRETFQGISRLVRNFMKSF